MNKTELRKLRGQVVLTVLLFGCTIGCALFIASRRAWFAARVTDTFTPAPGSMRGLIAAAEAGDLPAAQYSQLPRPQRLAFYYDWVLRPEGQRPPGVPALLVRTDPALFLARAEQTLITGAPTQRAAAAEFLARCADTRAIDILRRAGAYLERRGVAESRKNIDNAIDTLQNLSIPQETGSAPSTQPVR